MGEFLDSNWRQAYRRLWNCTRYVQFDELSCFVDGSNRLVWDVGWWCPGVTTLLFCFSRYNVYPTTNLLRFKKCFIFFVFLLFFCHLSILCKLRTPFFFFLYVNFFVSLSCSFFFHKHLTMELLSVVWLSIQKLEEKLSFFLLTSKKKTSKKQKKKCCKYYLLFLFLSTTQLKSLVLVILDQNNSTIN